jgi:hypothetical protein
MCKKLSSKRVEQIIANASASLSIEDIEVTDFETSVIKKYLLKIYSEKDILKVIKSR